MSMDEMIEVLARYRYNAKHDADRIKALEAELGRMRASSFVTAVPSEEYDKLEFFHRMDTLAIKKQKEEIERLKAEVERLNTGIQPEGSNDAVGRAVNVLLEKEKEIARLKAEVDRLAMSEGYHYTAIAVSTLKEQLHQKHIDYLEARKANEAKVEMIARLKAEVERLTNLKSGADYFKAEEGKQS